MSNYFAYRIAYKVIPLGISFFVPDNRRIALAEFVHYLSRNAQSFGDFTWLEWCEYAKKASEKEHWKQYQRYLELVPPFLRPPEDEGYLNVRDTLEALI